MNTVPIVFAFDEKLIMPAGVCLTSLLDSAAEDTFYDIFILHPARCDFSKEKLMQLPGLYKNCRITLRPVTDFAGAYEIRGVSEVTYYRLLIPELIPEYDKILYSDVDVIFREDQARYYATDLGDNYLAGVDSSSALPEEDKKYIRERLGIDPDKGYFYAGNSLINSALIRKDGLMTIFREKGKERFKFQDMDIFNLVCNGRILRLPLSCCFTNYMYYCVMDEPEKMQAYFPAGEIDAALQSGIVHYNGNKPWNTTCVNMDLWWTCYRKSIFFDEDFTFHFWDKECTKIERLSLWKRIKLVARYFREGGRR